MICVVKNTASRNTAADVYLTVINNIITNLFSSLLKRQWVHFCSRAVPFIFCILACKLYYDKQKTNTFSKNLFKERLGMKVCVCKNIHFYFVVKAFVRKTHKNEKHPSPRIKKTFAGLKHEMRPDDSGFIHRFMSSVFRETVTLTTKIFKFLSDSLVSFSHWKTS